jgi:hypothetical protein
VDGIFDLDTHPFCIFEKSARWTPILSAQYRHGLKPCAAKMDDDFPSDE